MTRAGSIGGPRPVCGVILHPSGHTLSPTLHRAAYEALGIDADFVAFDVSPDRLEKAIDGMRGLGIRQLAVSLPHKERALDLADRATDDARAIGAANTLTLEGDEIVAENTDWIGVVRALEPHGSLEGWRATVVGAGGAARAVVYALRKLGLEIAITGRTPERVESLVAALGGRTGSLDDPYDLLVNATPLGMVPDVESTPAPCGALRRGALVFDTVYRPLETRLLREARERGCRTQDGLDMLVHQAVEQIRIWSGKSPDAGAMRRAAEKVL
ncbi:MAG: shikimate dehydrogenase [Myxococcota bacterium]